MVLENFITGCRLFKPTVILRFESVLVLLMGVRDPTFKCDPGCTMRDNGIIPPTPLFPNECGKQLGPDPSPSLEWNVISLRRFVTRYLSSFSFPRPSEGLIDRFMRAKVEKLNYKTGGRRNFKIGLCFRGYAILILSICVREFHCKQNRSNQFRLLEKIYKKQVVACLHSFISRCVPITLSNYETQKIAHIV